MVEAFKNNARHAAHSGGWALGQPWVEGDGRGREGEPKGTWRKLGTAAVTHDSSASKVSGRNVESVSNSRSKSSRSNPNITFQLKHFFKSAMRRKHSDISKIISVLNRLLALMIKLRCY